MNGVLATILGLLFGSVAGSFLGTVAIRWPIGRSIVTGRSACDQCNARLAAADLIPIISFLLRRGRCRSCRASINRLHLAVELLCAGVAILSLAAFPPATAVIAALFGWMLVLLATLDLKHFWLPDLLTYGLAALGLVASCLPDGLGLGAALAGGLVGFCALWIVGAAFRRIRGIDALGGGDPKLFGAIGVWTGWAALPSILLLASTAGIAFAVIQYWGKGGPNRKTRIAFGACLAVAAWPIWMHQRLLLQ